MPWLLLAPTFLADLPRDAELATRVWERTAVCADTAPAHHASIRIVREAREDGQAISDASGLHTIRLPLAPRAPERNLVQSGFVTARVMRPPTPHDQLLAHELAHAWVADDEQADRLASCALEVSVGN